MIGIGKWVSVTAVVLVASSAFAQPARRSKGKMVAQRTAAQRTAVAQRGAAAKTPTPATAPATTPETPATTPAPAEPAPAEPASPAPADDLGAPPPAVKETKSNGASPLNPAAKEFPAGAIEGAPSNYDALLADVAALRARVAALTATLFRSRLRVSIATEGSDARVARVIVTLDDGIVFSAGDRFVADDGKVVYEHAVAPGNHVVGVEIERYAAQEGAYRTWQTSRFSVVVPENKLLETEVSLEDDSDMADDFPDDESGEYDLRVRLKAWVDS